MKILRIHLHPFGGATDRAFDLHDGLNVIEGPNEFGKSTLNHALWHALFTPTHLTPGKLRDTMGRWFPKPTGDHAKVTLQFQAAGEIWTLQKCWGAGGSSRLWSTQSAAIADPASVQKRLNELLQRNEATWRHVCFLNQAKLNHTLEDLRKESNKMDDLHPLLGGAAVIPGDLAPEKLESAIQSRIDDHSSHWDLVGDRPEGGRGIENPWANKIGPLLKAYYAMETTRREAQKVIDHEKKIDAIHAGIRHYQAAVQADAEFIETGKTLSEGLRQREGLEARINLLKAEQEALGKLLVEWPMTEKAITDGERTVAQLNETITKLEQELAHAKTREGAENLRAGHRRLTEARGKWQDALEKLNQSRAIPAELSQELAKLETSQEKLRIQIAAQKLSATIESKSARTFTVTRGAEPPEAIQLEPAQPWIAEAEGRFLLALDDLTIEVASATGDVQALFSQLDQCHTRQTEILAELGLENHDAVKAAVALHQKRVTAEREAKILYQAALQGKTEEEWAEKIQQLEALPQTRSVATIEEEKNKAVTQRVEQNHALQSNREKLARWGQEHGDPSQITTKFGTKAVELATAQNQLAGLPGLPQGYQSADEYLRELKAKEALQNEAKERLDELKLQQAALGPAPEQSAEELREELEKKQRHYHHEHEKGQALLRIQKTLATLVAARGSDDPMKGLESAIARHFETLTCGKYQGIRLEQGSPVEVSGPLRLAPDSLSQGTLGSLALATRLALAEFYLDGMDGFLVLDDPFTDMDPARRRAAGCGLGSFSATRQVLFFTCHPEHAEELEAHAGAKRPAHTQPASAEPVGA
jgi:DNA repair protein SbcC/Rad50